MSAAFFRKYATGTGADLYIPIIKRAAIDFAVSGDWTPAAGDVKVSIDGGAAANIGTLPTAVTMGNGAMWKFVFTNAELTGKYIAVTIVDAATKAIEDQMFVIETYGNASAMHQFDLNTATQSVNVASGGITSGSFAANAIAAAAIATDALGSAQLAASAATEIATAVASALAPATGIAQAGATGSITIAAGDSAATSAYIGRLCIITAGTGRGQARAVTANDGTTKVVTVAGNWSIVPDNTSRYALVTV